MTDDVEIVNNCCHNSAELIVNVGNIFIDEDNMNIKFYLQRPNNEQTTVMIDISVNSFRLRKATKYVAYSKYFDNGEYKKKHPMSAKLNNELNKIKIHLTELLLTEPNISREQLKAEIDYTVNGKQKNTENGKYVLEEWEKYVASRKSLIATNTYKSLLHSINAFKKYEEYSGKKICFVDIKQNFRNDILHYFVEKRNISNTTIKRYYSGFKTFLRYAYDMGMHTNDNALLNVELKNSKMEMVVLSEAELNQIKNTELPKRLDKARNIFLAQCYTGLRYSDVVNIHPDNIKNDRLHIQLQKTGDHVVIPIAKSLKPILDKFKNKIPKMLYSNYNKLVKQVCAYAGINETVEKVKFSGSKKMAEKVPKWSLIASHTARRTFITLSIEKGASANEIMKITGHKDMSVLQEYIKLHQEVAITKIKSIWDEI